MSFLPTQINFPKTEEEICEKWKESDTFQTQNRLGKERGDPVRWNGMWMDRSIDGIHISLSLSLSSAHTLYT